jgi:hypothetical protein
LHEEFIVEKALWVNYRVSLIHHLPQIEITSTQ